MAKYAFLNLAGSDEGVPVFARALIAQGFSILAEPDTAHWLDHNSVEVTTLSEVPADFELVDGSIELVYVTLPSFREIISQPQSVLPDPDIRQFLAGLDVEASNLIQFARQQMRTVVTEAQQQDRVLAWLSAGKPAELKQLTSLWYTASCGLSEYTRAVSSLLLRYLPE